MIADRDVLVHEPQVTALNLFLDSPPIRIDSPVAFVSSRFLRAAMVVLVPSCLLADTRFEISFPGTVHAAPITGRVFIMISRDTQRGPRLEVERVGIPFFGRDVEKLAPARGGWVSSAALR
jgi:hypothetical protein